jgi:hypothetical protein
MKKTVMAQLRVRLRSPPNWKKGLRSPVYWALNGAEGPMLREGLRLVVVVQASSLLIKQKAEKKSGIILFDKQARCLHHKETGEATPSAKKPPNPPLPVIARKSTRALRATGRMVDEQGRVLIRHTIRTGSAFRANTVYAQAHKPPPQAQGLTVSSICNRKSVIPRPRMGSNLNSRR